jgi:hypothetical protein
MSKDFNLYKSYWFWVAVIVVVPIFFFYLDFSRVMPVDARLIVKFNDNVTKTFEGSVIQDMTVLEAAEAASRGDNLKFNYFIDKQDNVNVASIGTTANGFNGKSWHFYLNKKLIETRQIDKVKIKRGDLIEVVFE